MARPIGEFWSEHWKKAVDRCAGCREVIKQRTNRRRESGGPESVRDANLRSKYGLSAVEYDALREAQGHRCAICGKHEDDMKVIASGRPRKDGEPSASSFKLVVDHCHDSRRVRGLLCSQCNSAIGLLGDSPETIRVAAAYVEADKPAATTSPQPIVGSRP